MSTLLSLFGSGLEAERTAGKRKLLFQSKESFGIIFKKGPSFKSLRTLILLDPFPKFALTFPEQVTVSVIASCTHRWGSWEETGSLECGTY